VWNSSADRLVMFLSQRWPAALGNNRLYTIRHATAIAVCYSYSCCPLRTRSIELQQIRVSGIVQQFENMLTPSADITCGRPRYHRKSQAVISAMLLMEIPASWECTRSWDRNFRCYCWPPYFGLAFSVSDESLPVCSAHHNRPSPREYQGRRSKVKVTWVFGCFSACMMLRLPADST